MVAVVSFALVVEGSVFRFGPGVTNEEAPPTVEDEDGNGFLPAGVTLFVILGDVVADAAVTVVGRDAGAAAPPYGFLVFFGTFLYGLYGLFTVAVLLFPADDEKADEDGVFLR